MANEVGIEGIKRVLVVIFKNLKIDRDGDGQISGGEWFAAAMSLFPEIISSGFIAEARDLTKDEVSQLFYWVHDFFPDHADYMPEIEQIVAKIARVGGAVAELWEAVDNLQKLKNTPVEVPAETLAVEKKNEPVIPAKSAVDAKVRGGAQKVEPGPDDTGEGSENGHNPDESGKEVQTEVLTDEV